MLKIKDNVNLEELEKFGFQFERGTYYIESVRSVMPSEKYSIKKHLAYSISSKSRKIKIYRNAFRKEIDNAEDLIFDLIIAGLVEKV